MCVLICVSLYVCRYMCALLEIVRDCWMSDFRILGFRELGFRILGFKESRLGFGELA